MPADVPTIVALATAMRAELGVMRGGALWLAREARPEPLDATYEDLIGRADATLLVGTIDDVVVGFGASEVENLRDGTRLGVVTDLFVEVEARAVGVGSSILDALVASAHDQGCHAMDAAALPGHRAAKNFFEQHGFVTRALTVHRRLTER